MFIGHSGKDIDVSLNGKHMLLQPDALGQGVSMPEEWAVTAM